MNNKEEIKVVICKRAHNIVNFYKINYKNTTFNVSNINITNCITETKKCFSYLLGNPLLCKYNDKTKFFELTLDWINYIKYKGLLNNNE